jgi:peptide/nickel transport system ATP-binding protein
MSLALEIRNLEVHFGRPPRQLAAVNGVSLQVASGQTLALIGESGSGKSVTLRAILRLHSPRSSTTRGSIRVGSHDVMALSPKALADFRGAVAAMVFQEPLLALDPVYPVGQQIVETMVRHRICSPAQARRRALELFEQVHIPSPERRVNAYPHELSGGMRQRAMIALALSCAPQLLLADEPTTALDATVQIQILLLLREMQQALGLAIVFVTHDIGAAVEVADHIAVMYAGRIVEEGSTRAVLRNPRHPYTQALLASRAHGALNKGERLAAIPGSPPNLVALPAGCAFAERCAWAQARCSEEAPEIDASDARDARDARDTRDALEIPDSHPVRCFFPLSPTAEGLN